MKLIITSFLILISLHSFSQKKDNNPIAVYNDSISKNSSDTLKGSIFKQINILDEVNIQSKSRFTALSLGIIHNEIKPLTQNERRLYTAGDFKAIHLLSLLGGSLQFDPIINAISGRTKRLKKYIQFEKKESNLRFLEEHFKDYMINNLNIGEDVFGLFLNFIIENENLQALIDRKNNGELYFFIGDEWFKFKNL